MFCGKFYMLHFLFCLVFFLYFFLFHSQQAREEQTVMLKYPTGSSDSTQKQGSTGSAVTFDQQQRRPSTDSAQSLDDPRRPSTGSALSFDDPRRPSTASSLSFDESRRPSDGRSADDYSAPAHHCQRHVQQRWPELRCDQRRYFQFWLFSAAYYRRRAAGERAIERHSQRLRRGAVRVARLVATCDSRETWTFRILFERKRSWRVVVWKRDFNHATKFVVTQRTRVWNWLIAVGNWFNTTWIWWTWISKLIVVVLVVVFFLKKKMRQNHCTILVL